jgi:hypothetical protein
MSFSFTSDKHEKIASEIFFVAIFFEIRQSFGVWDLIYFEEVNHAKKRTDNFSWGFSHSYHVNC